MLRWARVCGGAHRDLRCLHRFLDTRFRPELAAQLLELPAGCHVLFGLGLARNAAGELGLHPLGSSLDRLKVAIRRAVGEAAVGEPFGGSVRERSNLVAGASGDGSDGPADVYVGAEIVDVVPGGLSNLAGEVGRGATNCSDLVPFRGAGQGGGSGLDILDCPGDLVEKVSRVLDRDLAIEVLPWFRPSHLTEGGLSGQLVEFVLEGIERGMECHEGAGRRLG